MVIWLSGGLFLRLPAHLKPGGEVLQPHLDCGYEQWMGTV